MSYKIKLEIFEGPLDLLLYLIKKEEIDIYDIPIAKVTKQYLEYLEVMEILDLDIAGEFLVMASTLMQIKSKMLLPPDELNTDLEDEEELDPRAELVRRLLEYKTFKEAAGQLDEMGVKRRDIFTRSGGVPAEPDSIEDEETPYFEVGLFDLLSAFSKVLSSIPREEFQEIIRDEFTVEEKIHDLLHLLVGKPVIYFTKLFDAAKHKLEIITIFLALLELIRLKEVIVRQDRVFDEIQIIRNEKHKLAPDKNMGVRP